MRSTYVSLPAKRRRICPHGKSIRCSWISVTTPITGATNTFPELDPIAGAQSMSGVSSTEIRRYGPERLDLLRTRPRLVRRTPASPNLTTCREGLRGRRQACGTPRLGARLSSTISRPASSPAPIWLQNRSVPPTSRIRTRRGRRATRAAKRRSLRLRTGWRGGPPVIGQPEEGSSHRIVITRRSACRQRRDRSNTGRRVRAPATGSCRSEVVSVARDRHDEEVSRLKRRSTMRWLRRRPSGAKPLRRRTSWRRC